MNLPSSDQQKIYTTAQNAITRFMYAYDKIRKIGINCVVIYDTCNLSRRYFHTDIYSC